MSAPRPGLNAPRDLFLVSFLILFFELAAIRWFAATVVFLTFFTNIVLLACFLGMSVGLLAARRAQNLTASALPLAALAFGAASAIHLAYWGAGVFSSASCSAGSRTPGRSETCCESTILR